MRPKTIEEAEGEARHFVSKIVVLKNMTPGFYDERRSYENFIKGRGKYITAVRRAIKSLEQALADLRQNR